MSQEQNTSAAADRLQIREVSAGTGDGDSMANLNTAVLPDGAFCVVSEEGALYQLVKSSAATPVTGFIVAPSSGPGRWILFAASDVLSGPAQVGSTDFSTFAADGNWGPVTNTVTALDAVSSPAWTHAPASSILTYHGPTRKFAVTLAASAHVGAVGAAHDVFLGISKNNDLTGAPAAGTSGEIDTTPAAITVDYAMSTSRIVSLSSTDTLRPKMAASAAATSLGAMLRMIVTPA